MGRFVVRRGLTMVALLFAISFVTFLLFIVVLPGGNPAALIAGRLANAQEVHLISVKYGFDKPFYIQYLKTMANIFTGSAYSYQSGFNVLDEIKAGFPCTHRLRSAPASSGCWRRSRPARSRRSRPGATPTAC